MAAIAAQSFRGDAYKEGRDTFASRLQTLGAAYNILTEVSWGASDMGTVIESALAPFRTGDSRIAIAGPAVEISPGRALTLALAVNELATNAMKYGALSVEGGHVSVSWSSEAVEGGQRVRFAWRESNGPAVQPPTRTGFGSRLIRTMLAQDFGGTVELRYDPSGFACTLDATFV